MKKARSNVIGVQQMRVQEKIANSDMDSNYKEILKSLNRVRVLGKISQESVAEKSGLSKNMITRIETGNTIPRIVDFIKYARELGYELELKPVEKNENNFFQKRFCRKA